MRFDNLPAELVVMITNVMDKHTAHRLALTHEKYLLRAMDMKIPIVISKITFVLPLMRINLQSGVNLLAVSLFTLQALSEKVKNMNKIKIKAGSLKVFMSVLQDQFSFLASPSEIILCGTEICKESLRLLLATWRVGILHFQAYNESETTQILSWLTKVRIDMVTFQSCQIDLRLLLSTMEIPQCSSLYFLDEKHNGKACLLAEEYRLEFHNISTYLKIRPPSADPDKTSTSTYYFKRPSEVMLGGTVIEPSRPQEVASKAGAINSNSEENHPTDIRKMLAYIGATYFLLMTVLVVPVACVSTVVLVFPLIYFNMDLFSEIENKLCSLVNYHWVAASVYSGMTVTEYGADLRDVCEKRCLLLANHLGLMDHFVVMQSLHDKGSVPGKWLWVIYNIWKYTPLGLMWTAHGNFFVNGGPAKKEALLKTFKEHLKKYFTKYNYGWVVMYPEGSRLYLIKESGKRHAEKFGLAPLENCVYPRTGAAHAVMEVLAPSKENPAVCRSGGGAPVEYIVDATLGYPRGDIPELGNAMIGEWPHEDSSRISIHYSVHKVDPEWADEEKLKEFLNELYSKKDKLLQEYYSTGKFPGNSNPIIVSQTTTLVAQLFWLGLYYMHYSVWIKPLLSLVFGSFLAIFHH